MKNHVHLQTADRAIAYPPHNISSCMQVWWLLSAYTVSKPHSTSGLPLVKVTPTLCLSRLALAAVGKSSPARLLIAHRRVRLQQRKSDS